MEEKKKLISSNAAMCLLSMAVTACVMLLLFIINNIYPFGENTLIFCDGNEYLGVYNYLADTLKGTDNVLYSWRAYMGEGAIPFLAFYGSHPLYYLFAIFGNTPVALIHVLAVLKITSAAGTFCIYLNTRKEGFDPLKIFFSLNYALMAYVTIYIWNLTWLDGIVLLPLMFIGIKNILAGKKPWLYIISIAFAILFNFYIGYMMCFASLWFYIALILEEGNVFDRLKQSFLRYAGASLLGVGSVSFILIPAVLGMPDARKTDILSLLSDIRNKFSYSEFVAMLFNGKASTQAMDTNLPLIYVGIVPLLFTILFFWNSNVTRRKRIVWFGVIVFIMHVFKASITDIIMHGGSENICFNYRYSFIFSFVIAIIGYNATVDLTVYKNKFLQIIISVAALLLFVRKRCAPGPAQNGYFLSIAIMLTVIILLYAYNKFGAAAKKTFFVIVSILMLVDICTDAYCSLDKRMEESRKATVNTSRIVNGKSFAKSLAASDDEFYRNVISQDTVANTDFTYGNNGISTYLSARNADFVDSMRLWGFKVDDCIFLYSINVPASVDALLGFKNLSVVKDIDFKGYPQVPDDRIDNEKYYINDYAMGLIFPVKNLVEVKDNNSFELLRETWLSIDSSANTGSVWEENGDVTETDPENDAALTITFTGTGYPQYISIGAEGVKYKYHTPDDSGKGSDKSQIGYVGTFDKGETVTMNFYSDEPITVDDLQLYYENTDIYRAIAASLSYKNLDLKVKSSSDIIINDFNATADYVASSIPYDKQWDVYVDGVKTDTHSNLNGFLAFDIEKGTHDIELIFRPTGFTLGIAISVCSVIVIVLMILFEKRKKNI